MVKCFNRAWQVVSWVTILFNILIFSLCVAENLPGLNQILTITGFVVSYSALILTFLGMKISNPKSNGKKIEILSIDLPQFELFCEKCQIFVEKKTKHCSKCEKCVDDFDHHCKWMNLCIGKACLLYTSDAADE